MRRFTIKAVYVLVVVAVALGAFLGCGKKAPPSPPDEALSQRTLQEG